MRRLVLRSPRVPPGGGGAMRNLRLATALIAWTWAVPMSAQTMPEPAFGGLGTGFVNLPLNQGGLDRDLCTDMVVRADGRIVIAGSAQTATGLVAAVVQLTPDGRFDISFGGGDGKASFIDPADPGALLSVQAVALQSDGKIILVGFKQGGGSLAMRVLADGSALDPGFGNNGVAPSSATEFRDVAVDSSGRIVAVGRQSLSLPFISYDRIAVTRYTTAGQLDPSFGGTGRPYFDFGTEDINDYRGQALVIDHQQRIAVAAEVWTPDHGIDFGVLVLLSDGSPDPAFGNYGPVGRARVHFDQGGPGCNEDKIAAIAFHHSTLFPSTDRFLLAGTVCRSDGNRDFGVARLHANGELDVEFGGAGRQMVAFDLDGIGYDSATSIALQSPGLSIAGPTHLVVAGSALLGTQTDYQIALARLRLADGTLDPGFGNAGRYLFAIDLGGPQSDVVEAVIASATHITVAGWLSTPLNAGNDRDFLAARFVADDSIFAGGYE